MKHKSLLMRVMSVMLAVMLITLTIGCSRPSAPSKYSLLKINGLTQLLEKSYLGELDQKEIENSMYAGYVNALGDPLTQYLDEKAFQTQKLLTEGKILSTGMQVKWGLNAQYLIVTELSSNSPASRASIRQGDKIKAIDGIGVMPSNEMEIYQKLKDTENQEVIYTIESLETQKTREVRLKAEMIQLKNMSYQFMKDNIGYIALYTLKSGDAKELEGILDHLRQTGANYFILDLRDLYTLDLEEVYRLCELFIDNQLVFKVIDKENQVELYQTNEAKYQEAITLIVNSHTKGVIEGFVAAIKSSKRGLVVGETTAGLGLVSEIIPLGDDTALMVSTGIIYDAYDASLKKHGVKPDRELKNGLESMLEMMQTGKLSPENDLQLLEAIKTFE